MTVKQSCKLAILAISVMLLFGLKIAFATELTVGLMFPETDANYKGIRLAFKEYNSKMGQPVRYSFKVPSGFTGSFDGVNIRNFIKTEKIQVLLGATHDGDNFIRIVDKNEVLLVLLRDTNTHSLPDNVIILPSSNFLKEEEIDDFQKKYKESFDGETPDKPAAKKIYRAYDATTVFMKVVEKSNLLVKSNQGSTVKTLGTEFHENLKQVRVVEAAVAPLREGTPDQQNPANNPIKDDIVLKKGERVILIGDDQPLKNWIKVELFSDSTKVGWIHKMLVSE